MRLVNLSPKTRRRSLATDCSPLEKAFVQSASLIYPRKLDGGRLRPTIPRRGRHRGKAARYIPENKTPACWDVGPNTRDDTLRRKRTKRTVQEICLKVFGGGGFFQKAPSRRRKTSRIGYRRPFWTGNCRRPRARSSVQESFPPRGVGACAHAAKVMAGIKRQRKSAIVFVIRFLSCSFVDFLCGDILLFRLLVSSLSHAGLAL